MQRSRPDVTCQQPPLRCNDQGERREAAAADAELVSELSGCLPFAPPCGLPVPGDAPTPNDLRDPAANRPHSPRAPSGRNKDGTYVPLTMMPTIQAQNLRFLRPTTRTSTPAAKARQNRSMKTASPEPYDSEVSISLGRSRRKTPNSTYATALMWRQTIARPVLSFIGLVSANDQLTHSRREKVSAANRAPELPVILATAQRGGGWVERLVRRPLVAAQSERKAS